MNKRYTALFAALLVIFQAGLTACTRQQPAADNSSLSEKEKSAAGTEAPAEADAEPFDAEGMHFSAKSGFYKDAFSLTISAEDGAEIYYTTDGSDPTADSTQYTGPIEIKDRSSEPNVLSMHTDVTAGEEAAVPKDPVDKATVLKAVKIAADGTQSPVVVNTYFVGFEQKADYYRDMKVISVVTDEANLFDYDTGIYVAGKTYDDWKNSDEYDPATPEWDLPGNYTQKGKDWERPAAIQIFADAEPVVTQQVGIRIHGGATRSYSQKSLNVYARSEYGESKLNYDLFSGAVTSETDGSAITQYDRFMLRNGGNDAMFARFRDNLNQSLVADRAFLMQGMEPCIVFLNGEFWGTYDITESVDASTVKAHYGIPKKEVCIIKKEALDSGSEEDFAEWEAMRAWINETDLSDPDAYSQLCEQIDMQSFMDYVSAEVYINNANWGASNMAMWKATVTDAGNPFADGKWRFIMYDTDYSTGIYGEARPDDPSLTVLLEDDCFLSDLLRAALKNESFRESFRETFTEIAEDNFSDAKVSAMIGQLSDRYQDASVATFDRFWNGQFSAEQQFKMEVTKIRDFYQKRHDSIMEDLESQLTE